MPVSTGLNWKICVYSGTTPSNIGGLVTSCIIEKKASNKFEPYINSRKAELFTSNIYWRLQFEMKVQDLTSFVIDKCFVSNEGALPTFNLYTDDGVTKNGWTNCLVNSCDLSFDQEGYLTAAVEVFSLGNEAKDFTVPALDIEPISKVGVTSLNVGTTNITKWTSIRFGVKNNVQTQASGNSLTMTELYYGHVEYNFDLQLLADSPLLYSFDGSTKRKTIDISIRDNKATPVTKTFSFVNTDVSSNSKQVERLNLTYEHLSGVCNSLVIT